MRKPLYLSLSVLILYWVNISGQDRSNSGFSLTGSVVFEDGQPVEESIEVMVVCSGAVFQRVYTRGGGQFSFYLASNTAPGTKNLETIGSPSGGGFRTFNQFGRGFGDDGNWGSGRTSRAGRINLSDCEIRTALAGFSSDVISLGIRDVMDPPDVGTITLRRMRSKQGTMVSLKTLLAPKEAQKAFRKANKELSKDRPNYSKAVKSLEKAVKIYPEFATAWNALGRCELARNKPDAAVIAFHRSIEEDPGYLAPHLGVVDILLRQGRFKEAQEQSRLALELDPGLPRSCYFFAYSSFALNEFERAEEYARMVLDSGNADRFPGVHYVLGVVWSNKGDYGPASVQLNRFLELVPEYRGAKQIEAKLKQWEEAGLTRADKSAPPTFQVKPGS